MGGAKKAPSFKGIEKSFGAPEMNTMTLDIPNFFLQSDKLKIKGAN